MNKRKFTSNIVRVMTSRAIMLVSEILLGFLVPKILGVTGYGYLKTYSLYTAYSALLHFGFVDGVLLYFAGKEYNELDKKRMRTFSRFYIYFECLIAVILFAVCTLFFSAELKFIGLMLAINTVIINLTSYYQFVSQATQRFTELSMRNILIAVCKMLLVCTMVVSYQLTGRYVSYQWYIIILNVIDGGLMFWYVYTYKDITFGQRDSIASCKNEIIHFFKNGISLTIAYQVAHIVFILDRQFVSILYSAEVFAIYSFAYSLVAVCTKIISSLSTVLFPMLKQMREKAAMQYYSIAISLMLIVSGAVLAGYYPISWFVNWFLPSYEGAVVYLKIIMPALLLNCCISVIIFTFYKVLDKSIVYFKFSCVALAISFLLNLLAQVSFENPDAISWASVVSMFLWYMMNQWYFVKKFRIKWKINILYAIVVMAIFYLVAMFEITWWLGMILYSFLYLVITVLFFYRTDLKEFLMKKGK